jgi:hypothetical protein
LCGFHGCRLPGDYGFDPLGLGEQPEDLKWYVQAELVHCRFAMAGVAGILGTDVSFSQLNSLPIPVKISILFSVLINLALNLQFAKILRRCLN